MNTATATKKRNSSYKGPACPFCSKPLNTKKMQPGPQVYRCNYCFKVFDMAVFNPPESKAVTPEETHQAVTEGTVCAFHERNKAVETCGRCGSFICELCKIETDDAILCPRCFDKMSSEGKISDMVTTFQDYSGMAVISFWAGVFLFVIGIFGIATIYYALKGINQKNNMNESDGVTKLYILIVLGILETIGCLVFWGFVIFN